MKVIYQELEVNKKIIRGLLSMPNNHQYHNIVVMFHGFTGHKNEHGLLFKQLTDWLVDLNYATLRFDFSGSGDSDGDFQEMTYFTELEEAQEIIKYAYKMMHKPIIVLGFSMGGAIGSEVSGILSDLVEQVILLSPAGNIDKIAFNRMNNSQIIDGKIDMGGYFLSVDFAKSLENHDLYQSARSFSKPVLIIHGSEDQAVPIEYGKKYHELYLDSKMFVIEGSPHGYSSYQFREQIKEIIINYLGGQSA